MLPECMHMLGSLEQTSSGVFIKVWVLGFPETEEPAKYLQAGESISVMTLWCSLYERNDSL